MKSYNKLFEKVISDENLREAFKNASKGKRNRNDVKRCIKHLPLHMRVVKYLICQYVKGIIPSEKLCKNHEIVTINEGTGKKCRRIQKPIYKYEQVIHHAIMQVFIPIVMKSLSPDCCGSIPGRGAVSTKNEIDNWIQNDPKNTKYAGFIDIHHFFESVDRNIIKKMLSKCIRDKKYLKLLYLILDSCKKGLALGFYSSQWFAAFLLTGLDHFIKSRHMIKVGNRNKVDYSRGCGSKHYRRYMDDLIIFGNNKREIHKSIMAIMEYLKNRLHLQIKHNYQVFRLEYWSAKTKRWNGRVLDYIGYRFHRNRTFMRKSILLRTMKRFRTVSRHLHNHQLTFRDAAGALSSMGWIYHTNSHDMFKEKIKPILDIKVLKEFVSKHQKHINNLKRLEAMSNGKLAPC